MNVIAIATLRKVLGSKRLPPDMAAHVAAFVERLIEQKFQRGGKPIAEREIAEAMGLKQSVLNQIRNQKGATRG